MSFAYYFPLSPCDVGQLHQEINSSSLSSLIFFGITNNGSSLKFEFENSLNSSQQTILSNLISSHVPDGGEVQLGEKFADINMGKTVSSSSYATCGTFFFPGTSSGGSIDTIKILSNLTSGSSYSIRIYDTGNKKTIAEQTFSNTTSTYNDMGTLTNLPRKSSQFEIQAKAPGSARAFIDNASIF